jgi:hypothetical protein
VLFPPKQSPLWEETASATNASQRHPGKIDVTERLQIFVLVGRFHLLYSVITKKETLKMELPIYNCHIHTFTAEHIPDRFLPLGLNKILKVKFIRRTLINLIALVDK